MENVGKCLQWFGDRSFHHIFFWFFTSIKNELIFKELNKSNWKGSVWRFRTSPVYLIVCQVRWEDQHVKTHFAKSSISKACEICCQQMLPLILIKLIFKSGRRIFCCFHIEKIILHVFQILISFSGLQLLTERSEIKRFFTGTTFLSVIAGGTTQPFYMEL